MSIAAFGLPESGHSLSNHWSTHRDDPRPSSVPDPFLPA